MQGGSLKKRTRRPITKVSGLSIIPFDEESESWKISDFYQDEGDPKAFSFQTGNGSRSRNSTALQMSAIFEQNRSSGKRVTRDPMFSAQPRIAGTTSSALKQAEGQYAHNKHFETEDFEEYEKHNNYEVDTKVKENPFLLNSMTIFKLRLILLLGGASGAIPWSWDSKTHRIEMWTPSIVKIWRLLSVIFIFQTFCLTIFQIWSFYTRVVEQKERNYRVIFQSSFGTFWYVCALYFFVNLVFYKDEMRQYVNTLLETNRKFVDMYVINTDSYQEGGQTLTTFFVYCNTAQVFVSVAVFLGMPYQPWYLFSYIYDATTTPWYWLIPGALQEFFVIGQVIFSFIFTSWAVVAHSNSVGFWLREIHHNNDTGSTKTAIRGPRKAIEMYRSLQVLCTCFND